MNLLSIVDEYLNRQVVEGLNKLPVPIPPEMATGPNEGEWKFWVPVSSTVTSVDLERLEGDLGVALSPQYKSLLRHKHFLELQIADVSFFRHPSVGWQDSIKQQVLRGWPREHLLDKGLLPFADYSDWGLWCFGAREADGDGEYPIYLWDHDRPTVSARVANNLEAGLAAEVERARA